MLGKNLDEISFIRPILIVLLVLYHAFCTWTGAWKPFAGYEPNELYKWIADFAYSFMLPMFVFQSGYVWAFQRNIRVRKEELKELIIKKGKRLIIPSVIFSIIYLLIFNDGQSALGIQDLIVKVLSGIGHLWFLPMLFWCFIISWMLQRIDSKILVYIVLINLIILSIFPIPFQINKAFSYVLYFQIGYNTFAYSDNIRSICSEEKLIFSWTLFIIAFIGLNILKDKLSIEMDNMTIFIKAAILEIVSLITIAYSLMGILAMYMTSMYYTKRQRLSQQMIRLGNLCFGVYIFQQFIIIGIYNYTSLPLYLGLSLPWLSFIIALCCSIILCYTFRMTSLGRKLI